MAEALCKDQKVQFEEAVMRVSYETSAMFNVLERKGLITRQEVLDEIKRIKEEMQNIFEVVK